MIITGMYMQLTASKSEIAIYNAKSLAHTQKGNFVLFIIQIEPASNYNFNSMT